jgi:hypothetical protein
VPFSAVVEAILTILPYRLGAHLGHHRPAGLPDAAHVDPHHRVPFVRGDILKGGMGQLAEQGGIVHQQLNAAVFRQHGRHQGGQRGGIGDVEHPAHGRAAGRSDFRHQRVRVQHVGDDHPGAFPRHCPAPPR